LWWNRYETGTPPADGRPHNYLASLLNGWSGVRQPFVTFLIHENNFTRRGVDPWVNTFWEGKDKTTARSANYDLEATDPSTVRSAEEQSRILTAYNELIEYCAKNHTVVTMEDIYTLSQPATAA
jgi:hypothetical protein